MRPSPENETGLDPPNMRVDRTLDSRASSETCRESFRVVSESVSALEVEKKASSAVNIRVINRFDEIVILEILLWINKNRGYRRIRKDAFLERSILVDNCAKKFDAGA